MQVQKPKQGYKLVKSLFGKYEEIPEEWNVTQYKNVCEFVNGYAYSQSEFREKGYPIIRIQNLTGGNNYVYSDVPLPEKQFAVKGDLLFAWSATFGPYIWNGPKAAFHYHQWKVIPKSSVDKQFLYYVLAKISPTIKTMGQSGLGMFHMTKDGMEKFTIFMPPYEEQQKIASVLSNVDSLIQQTQKEIEQTQKLKKGLMQQLLIKGIGHAKFKKVKWNYGKLLEIPENWDVVLLDDVTKRGSGHTPDAKIPEYYNGGIKWISLADSKKLDNVYISETEKEISKKGIENSSAVKHPVGIVVLSRDAGVGKSAITTTEMAVSQHFMAWKCGDDLNNHFLYYLLQFWKPLFESIAIGTTIKTIGLPFFKKFKIILPSRKEQDKIAQILLNVDKSLWKLQEYRSNLENLKKGLMQKLLTGQIRVKV